MITWEHVRFLALLIPTWLLLAAVAITLAVPSQSRAGGADSPRSTSNLIPFAPRPRTHCHQPASPGLSESAQLTLLNNLWAKIRATPWERGPRCAKP